MSFLIPPISHSGQIRKRTQECRRTVQLPLHSHNSYHQQATWLQGRKAETFLLQKDSWNNGLVLNGIHGIRTEHESAAHSQLRSTGLQHSTHPTWYHQNKARTLTVSWLHYILVATTKRSNDSHLFVPQFINRLLPLSTFGFCLTGTFFHADYSRLSWVSHRSPLMLAGVRICTVYTSCHPNQQHKITDGKTDLVRWMFLYHHIILIVLLPVFRGKGDPMECGSYRVIKLQGHATNIKPFWILMQQKMTEPDVVPVTMERRAELQSDHHHRIPTFTCSVK